MVRLARPLLRQSARQTPHRPNLWTTGTLAVSRVESLLQGFQETACSAHDPPPQRSASSDPPANRAGIIARESRQAQRFHTARVNRVISSAKSPSPLHLNERTCPAAIGSSGSCHYRKSNCLEVRAARSG